MFQERDRKAQVISRKAIKGKTVKEDTLHTSKGLQENSMDKVMPMNLMTKVGEMNKFLEKHIMKTASRRNIIPKQLYIS